MWGEQPPASSAKVVQGCVSRLRKALGAEAIETVARRLPDAVRPARHRPEHFEDLVERARGHLATRTPERAIAMLTHALALWRGPAFGELEDWMPGRLEAVRLGQLRLAAEEDLLAGPPRRRGPRSRGGRRDRADRSATLPRAAVGPARAGAVPQRPAGRRPRLDPVGPPRARPGARPRPGLGAGRRSRAAILPRTRPARPTTRRGWRTSPARGRDWRRTATDDGDTFFGRAADVAACLARLRESSLLVVTGPSGCGKSSLVQAGLVPALRRERGGTSRSSPRAPTVRSPWRRPGADGPGTRCW